MCVVVLAVGAMAAAAQDLSENIHSGQQAFREGHYQEAERAFQEASKQAATLPVDDLQPASVLHDLGITYLLESKYDDAERTLKESIKRAESAGGPLAPLVAADCDGLVRLYARLGRVEDAIKSGKRGLAVRQAALPADDPEIATNLSNLGTLYFAYAKLKNTIVTSQNTGAMQPSGSSAQTLGRARQLAAQRRQSSQAMDATEFVPNEPAVETKIFYDGGRLEVAQRYYAQALAIREKRLPASDPLLADNLEKLANTFATERKYREAARTYEGLLAIEEQKSGEGSPRVPEVLDEIAQMDAASRSYREAADDYARDIKVREKLYGAGSPQLVEPLKRYALVLKKIGRDQEAKTATERASTILATYQSQRQ